MQGLAPTRQISGKALRLFLMWTAFWWGATGICAVLFFTGVLDFPTSAKVSLYGTSIWLNGWLLAIFTGKRSGADEYQILHDCLSLWMISYCMTNLLWEIPWVICSPFVFENLHTLEDIVAYTPWVRESIVNMYWWVLASFGSVDLRTVNHDPTFYTLELYAFVNVLTIFYFFHLNKKRSPHRYLVAVIGCGEPIASTFIFSVTEIFADFENMAGGIADTLLALVWTQYQYILFPLIFGWLGYKLLLKDWQDSQSGLIQSR